nr:heavy metal-binding domain-containing protein [Brevundimonas sp.]
MLVATTNDLAGYRIVKHLGMARGVTVRSRNAVSDFVGGIHAMIAGVLRPM